MKMAIVILDGETRPQVVPGEQRAQVGDILLALVQDELSCYFLQDAAGRLDGNYSDLSSAVLHGLPEGAGMWYQGQGPVYPVQVWHGEVGGTEPTLPTLAGMILEGGLWAPIE